MRALWSAGWAVAAAAYFAAGGDASPITLGIMVGAVLLGFVLGTVRRWQQPVLGAWAAVIALTLIALIAWLDALDSLLQLSTLAAVIASAGYVSAAPAKEAAAPTAALRALTPATRGLALAILVIGAGVIASVHVAGALTVAVALTAAWAVLSTRAGLSTPAAPGGGVTPFQLLQGVLITLGLGAWAVLALLIMPQLRIPLPWDPVSAAAVPVGIVLGLGMLGAGLGLAAAVPLVDRGVRPMALWTLGPAVIGMLMLMVARPGPLAALALVGVPLVAFSIAGGFRLATAQPPQRASDEIVFARSAAPAALAAAAVGALTAGLLAGVAADRDVVLLPVVLLSIAAAWIDLQRHTPRS